MVAAEQIALFWIDYVRHELLGNDHAPVVTTFGAVMGGATALQRVGRAQHPKHPPLSTRFDPACPRKRRWRWGIARRTALQKTRTRRPLSSWRSRPCNVSRSVSQIGTRFMATGGSPGLEKANSFTIGPK